MAFSIFLSPNYPFSEIPSPISPIPKHQPPSFSLRSSSLPPPPSSFDLRLYWTSLISQIEAELDASIPVSYPESIYKAMRYSVLSNGAKRASPILCIAACELVGGNPSVALPASCALEMVHAASLIHDDLPCMDGASVRRGTPSSHSLFGISLAVLAGDALFPLAFRHIVARTPPSLVSPQSLLRVIEEIARAVGSTGMAAGQVLDLFPDSADAMKVIEKKFGEMAECSAVCGGLLGGANEEEVEALRRYGRAVGVLYEVVDDILMKGMSNGPLGKMICKASVVRAAGVERAMEIAEELRQKAKKELEPFGNRYGDRVLPLYSFVDYAVERGFVVESSGKAASTTGGVAVSSS